VAIAAFAVSASAGGISVYSSQTDYAAATTGNERVDFESLTPEGTYLFALGSPLVVGSAEISNENGINVYHGAFQWEGTTLAALRCSSDYPTDVKFASPFTAAAVEYYPAVMPPDSGAVHGLITLSDDTTRTFEFSAATSSTLDFLGIVSTTPGVSIRSITAYGDGAGYVAPGVVGVTYGYAVPEPSTVTLVTVGLLGLLAYAWRKRTWRHLFSMDGPN
jgi:hypothetical protein